MRPAKKPRHPARWLAAVLGAVLAIGLTGLACAPAADGAMYWGGTISGSVYGLSGDAPWNQTVQSRFEADAGKQITMVNTGQSWATFDAATMKEALASGAIPLVTMGLQGQTLAEIAAGEQDSEIRAWARAAKAFGYPFLFRPWWEMNGTWYSWGRSPDFVAAWQHFHDVVEEVGATNVTWAWVPNTIWGEPASDPTAYYPGSAYVDWVGMDAYNFGLNPLQSDRWTSPAETIGPTLEVLNRIAPGKPVCICEIASTEIGGNKATWITELLQRYLPSQPSIQAVLWFNYNIEANGGRFDWPIESSTGAEKAFHEGIQNSIYISSLPTLTPLAKLPVPSQAVVAPAPPAGAPAPSKGGSSKPKRHRPRIEFLSAHLNRHTGIARLKLRLPRSGTVQLSGEGIRARVRWSPGGSWSDVAPLPVVKRLRRPRDIELKIGSTGSALKALVQSGETKIVLAVRLASANGSVIHGKKPLTLKRDRAAQGA
jgi:Glycosyl hydrolase family 26